MTAGADVDVWGQLAVSLGSVAAELRADREYKRQLAASLWFQSAPAMGPFSAMPFASPTWGPNDGYAWAVQRVTVAGFGATTDLVTAYRGNSVTDVQPQNALFTFSVATVGAVATWHPGGKGLVLKGGEGMVFGGTFTGTAGAINVDVVHMELDKLPCYLL